MQECPCSCIPESSDPVFMWHGQFDQTGWETGFRTFTRTCTSTDHHNTFERFIIWNRGDRAIKCNSL